MDENSVYEREGGTMYTVHYKSQLFHSSSLGLRLSFGVHDSSADLILTSCPEAFDQMAKCTRHQDDLSVTKLIGNRLLTDHFIHYSDRATHLKCPVHLFVADTGEQCVVYFRIWFGMRVYQSPMDWLPKINQRREELRIFASVLTIE